ncbi:MULTISPECIES: hypothetical protein [unclassified Curtobacterium]|nr:MULTISPECIES: hypothetical protein [unclassified Curtobacterium]
MQITLSTVEINRDLTTLVPQIIVNWTFFQSRFDRKKATLN